MPLYDFRCLACGQVYEVDRSIPRRADPLFCAIDGSPCERLLTAPAVLSKSSPSYVAPSNAQRAAAWSHFGHTHAEGTGGHAHGATESTDTGSAATSSE